MNKKVIFIIFFSKYLSVCELIENIVIEYNDWKSLMNASEKQKRWFPSLFKGKQWILEHIINSQPSLHPPPYPKTVPTPTTHAKEPSS